MRVRTPRAVKALMAVSVVGVAVASLLTFVDAAHGQWVLVGVWIAAGLLHGWALQTQIQWLQRHDRRTP